MRQSYKLIFERSREGRRAYDLPALDVPAANCAIPENMRAESKLDLPELGEVDLVRHYTNLPAAISALTTGSILSAPAR